MREEARNLRPPIPHTNMRIIPTSERKGQIPTTEAGDIPIIISDQTQHSTKVIRKVRRKEMEKENEAKAVEEDGKGRGKAIAAPTENNGKGK